MVLEVGSEPTGAVMSLYAFSVREVGTQQLMTLLRFSVVGTPAPQGSKKFVGHAKSTGRAILVESSKKVRPWRQDVVAEALRVLSMYSTPAPPPFDGPLIVRMVFTLKKPLSAPKKRRIFADRKPDLSKLARSTEDALTDAGVLADDARIIEYERLAKVYPGEDHEALNIPGVMIEIKQAFP
jgi:Holliday junction resolvase RusA-like endonuclease